MWPNWMWRNRRFLAVTTLVLLWGCDIQETLVPTTLQAPLSELRSGRVLDYQTQRGIAGVQVHISGSGEVVTDEEGIYIVNQAAFTPLSKSPVTITAEAAGYHTAVVVVRTDAQDVSVPVVLLRRIAPTVLVGPEGGVLESEGVRVLIPPGALTEVVPLSVAITNEHALMVRDSSTFAGTLGVDLRPYGLRFARPVEITVLLPTLHVANTSLSLFRTHGTTRGLESVGIAVVHDDGRSAEFSLNAFPNYETEVATSPYYTRIGPKRASKAPFTVSSKCGDPIKVHVRQEFAASGISVPEYQHPQLSADGLRSFITNLGYTASGGLIIIQQGEGYRLVTDVYNDHYTGTETGSFFDPQWQVYVHEPINFSYMRSRWENRKVACHVQGAS